MFTIFIEKDKTSKGIGEEVITILKEKIMPLLEINVIIALVHPSNKKMQNFITRQGFKLEKPNCKINSIYYNNYTYRLSL